MTPPANAMLDFIHEANASQSGQELCDAFVKFISSYGYSRFTLGYIQTESCELTDKEKNFGLMVNYPDEWLERYMNEHYILVDPVYRKCLNPGAPFTWKEALLENPTPQSIKMMAEAKEFSLREGIGLSFYQGMGRVAGFGISGTLPNARNDADALSELRLGAMHCFEKYYDLVGMGTENDGKPILTAREREVLLRVAQGMTKSEVADALGIGESCVKRHCESVFRKLNATSLASAAIKAYRLDLIRPF